MSQDNNQNDREKRQGQGDNWQGEGQDQNQGRRDQGSEDMTRESRSSGYAGAQTEQGGMHRDNPSSSPELDDMDEMDEDREDDDRLDGSPNRRNNIG